jgi:hypothetical protein
VNVAKGEMVERELNQMIERRSRHKDPEEEHELWKTSIAAYHERQKSERRAAWASFHEAQAERHRRTLEALINHHENEAEKYLPKGAA